MMISYNLGIPAATNNPSTDQPNMLANTNNIATLIAVDHVGFNASSPPGGGTHKQVTLTNKSAPGIGTGSGVLFCNTVSGQSQPFWQNAVTTKQVLTLDGTPVSSNNGYTFLPGGILLQWGQKTTPGTSGTVTFPIAFSSAPYSITIGMRRPSGSSANQSIFLNTVIAASYNYDSTSANTDPIYWMAVGPK